MAFFSNTRNFFGLPLLALAMSGCATVGSTDVKFPSGDTRPKADTITGIAYFLPRQLTKITATRVNLKIENLVGKVTKAQSNLVAAQAAAKTAEAEVEAGYSAVASANTPEAASLLEKRLGNIEKKLTSKNTAVATAKTNLKKAVADLEEAATASESASSDNNHKVTVSLSLLPPTGDAKMAFRLNPRHSILRDDSFDVEVGKNGLLKSSTIIAEDRTDDIIVEIGKLAGGVIGLSGEMIKVNKDGSGTPETKECPSKITTFTATIDLTNAREVKTLNGNLECLGAKIKPAENYAVQQPKEGPKLGTLHWANAKKPKQNESANQEIKGIAYRTPADFRIEIQKRTYKRSEQLTVAEENAKRTTAELETARKNRAEDAIAYGNALRAYLEASEEVDAARFAARDWSTSEVVYLNLPQAGPISILPQNAGAFVKTEYKLGFDNGILTRYQATRPSELATGVGIPFRVIDGVADGIAKIISIRIDQTKKLAELSGEQLALLNAEAAFERAGISNQTKLSQEQVALANQLTAAEVATIKNEIDLSLEQEKQLEQLVSQQYTQQIANLNQQNTLAMANQTLQNTISQTQNSSITNQTLILLSQLNQLTQQKQLTIAQTQLPTEILTSQVNAQLQAQIQKNIRACIEEQLGKGFTDVSICVSDTEAESEAESTDL